MQEYLKASTECPVQNKKKKKKEEEEELKKSYTFLISLFSPRRTLKLGH